MWTVNIFENKKVSDFLADDRRTKTTRRLVSQTLPCSRRYFNMKKIKLKAQTVAKVEIAIREQLVELLNKICLQWNWMLTCHSPMIERIQDEDELIIKKNRKTFRGERWDPFATCWDLRWCIISIPTNQNWIKLFFFNLVFLFSPLNYKIEKKI